MLDLAKNSLKRLIAYCQRQNWMGYDPFDGLNSRFFQALPAFKKQKLFRLLFLQFNKKSVINFRPVLNVSQGRNPKGIGLFLSGAANLYKQSGGKDYLSLIEKFVQWLKEDSSPDYHGYCWGYNFDWQSRAFFLPRGTPTVVNTSFIGRAFLNAYEALGYAKYLEIARSACDFILRDLNRQENEETLCFSYSPCDQYYVNNATALASSLLALTYEKTKEEELAQMARKSVQYVVNNQNSEGAWKYGESAPAQKVGIDNFHTGFILESLKIYADCLDDSSHAEQIKRGLEFYQEKFFLKDGTPRYFPHKNFPADIHSAAQAIITFVQLKKYGANGELCQKVLEWMIKNMQDKDGCFYYQKSRYFTNKIPYIRWCQAWAFLALTTYLLSHEQES